VGTKRRATKPGMGAVNAGSRESDIPPAPVSCPAPDPPPAASPAGSKRRSTLRRQGSSPKTKKASSRPKIPPAEPPKPFEPSTGRYATVPERREEVVLAKSKPPARPTKTSLRVATSGRPAPLRASEKPKAKRVVPRILKTDLGKTKLGPRDAFLLSRIDGVLAVEDLADLTGMRETEVMESLEQLAMLGLVRF
jgi:hypothetical protein